MNPSLYPAIAGAVWAIGMWIAYIIAIGQAAKEIHNRQVFPVTREQAIEKAKDDFWAPTSTEPFSVIFWPVVLVILLILGIKGLFVWWTNFFIKRLT